MLFEFKITEELELTYKLALKTLSKCLVKQTYKFQIT